MMAGLLGGGGILANPRPGQTPSTQTIWDRVLAERLGRTQTGAPALLPPSGPNDKSDLPPGTPPQETPVVDPMAAINAAARAASVRQNENTRSLVDGQYKLLDSFGKQRDIKLTNIEAALAQGRELLMGNYGTAIGGLMGSAKDNDAAEADASFSNIANAVRERGDLMSQVASQGAGETDLMRATLQSLRNYGANQEQTNRAFFDTLRSVNSAIGSLNRDTSTGKANLWQQAEGDREAAHANYWNQLSDTWTQIWNIENSNTNVNGPGSVAYEKKYGNAADEAANAAAQSYLKKGLPANYLEWEGKGETQQRALTSSNKAATVNLGGEQKRPEGATLRRW